MPSSGQSLAGWISLDLVNGCPRLDKRAGSRAHRYRAAGDIADFLASAGGAEVDRLIKQYGDVALAAFADRLDSLTPATSEALRKLRQQK